MPYPFSFCIGSVFEEGFDVAPLRKTISPSSFTPTNCNCFSASGGLAVSLAVRSIVSDSFQEQAIFQELYCYKQKHTFIQFIISTTCYKNRQKNQHSNIFRKFCRYSNYVRTKYQVKENFL